MSRDFSGWATPARRPRRRLTWPMDLVAVARAFRWGRRRHRPAGAPPRDDAAEPRHRELKPVALMPWQTQRVAYEISGSEALAGLETPLIVAANHQSVLDASLLKAVLPNRWRVASKDFDRALAAGRSVLLFPGGEPTDDGTLGPFEPLAAELAQQYGVAIVPVAISGTMNLKALLRLRGLRGRPTVVVRFGHPMYVTGRTIASSTDELHFRIAELLGEDDLTWWEVTSRGQVDSADPEMSKWRRIWQQSELPSRIRRRSRNRIWS